MFAQSNTISLLGMDCVSIEVQVQTSKGIPSFVIVGLPDKTISESKERIRSAIISMGLSMPNRKITVNLSPANVYKIGSHYDLPIAMAILGSIGIAPLEELDNYIFMGELSLSGKIMPVNGILSAAIFAAKQDKTLVCACESLSEIQWLNQKIDILGAETLMAVINHLRGEKNIINPPYNTLSIEKDIKFPDFKNVQGQEIAKRAMSIAAAGRHNLLMCGPPGSGKSMMASRMPGIMPTMNAKEILEVATIYSISGLQKQRKLTNIRPFRDPHHSASNVSLIGGGRKIKPGEVSLAHNGVLFLDELPEFSRNAIEALRQPIENGYVVIARAEEHLIFPANFQLIAAMNPCRCGEVDPTTGICKRGIKCLIEYQSKISAPLYDRFDMFISVGKVNIKDIMINQNDSQSTSSAEIKDKVNTAKKMAEQRFKNTDLITNSDISADNIHKFIKIDAKELNFLQDAAEKLKLSARSYLKTMKVAKTIADLESCETIKHHHLSEALSYRKNIVLKI